MKHFGKVKDFARDLRKPNNSLDSQLREATSKQNWGVPSSVLQSIALATHDPAECDQILQHCWNVLGDRHSKWQQIYKALNLMEACLKHGSEKAIEGIQKDIWRVQQWREHRVMEGGKEVGGGIREKANSISDLCGDKNMLQRERDKAHNLSQKMTSQGTGTVDPRKDEGGPEPYSAFHSPFDKAGKWKSKNGDFEDGTPGRSRRQQGGSRHSKTDQNSMVEKFTAVTNASKMVARDYLERNDYDMQTAVNQYLAEMSGEGFNSPSRRPGWFETKKRAENVMMVAKVSEQRAMELLERSGWDVGSAINQYYQDGGGSGGFSGPSMNAQMPPPPSRNNRPSSPSSGSGSTSSSESEQGPPDRGQQGGPGGWSGGGGSFPGGYGGKGKGGGSFTAGVPPSAGSYAGGKGGASPWPAAGGMSGQGPGWPPGGGGAGKGGAAEPGGSSWPPGANSGAFKGAPPGTGSAWGSGWGQQGAAKGGPPGSGPFGGAAQANPWGAAPSTGAQQRSSSAGPAYGGDNSSPFGGPSTPRGGAGGNPFGGQATPPSSGYGQSDPWSATGGKGSFTDPSSASSGFFGAPAGGCGKGQGFGGKGSSFGQPALGGSPFGGAPRPGGPPGSAPFDRQQAPAPAGNPFGPSGGGSFGGGGFGSQGGFGGPPRQQQGAFGGWAPRA